MMRPVLGRRTLFFALLALTCVALVPLTPPEFRWVAWGTAGLGAFWAILHGVEDVARPRAERRERARTEVEMPFGPPPLRGR